MIARQRLWDDGSTSTLDTGLSLKKLMGRMNPKTSGKFRGSFRDGRAWIEDTRQPAHRCVQPSLRRPDTACGCSHHSEVSR